MLSGEASYYINVCIQNISHGLILLYEIIVDLKKNIFPPFSVLCMLTFTNAGYWRWNALMQLILCHKKSKS